MFKVQVSQPAHLSLNLCSPPSWEPNYYFLVVVVHGNFSLQGLFQPNQNWFDWFDSQHAVLFYIWLKAEVWINSSH